jgi:hypothetical protein
MDKWKILSKLLQGIPEKNLHPENNRENWKKTSYMLLENKVDTRK